MDITIKRKPSSHDQTLSEWYVGKNLFCVGVEDPVRPAPEPKVFGKTAIPAGKYEVVVTYSNRFKKPLPLLIGVPGFEGVRIHPGNWATDTEGCLLPGTSVQPNGIGVAASVKMFDRLFALIQEAVKKEKVYVTLIDAPTLPPKPVPAPIKPTPKAK